MDASTAIPAATFFRMLARLVPTRDGRSMPWDALPWRPRIHLGLFVHRVNDCLLVSTCSLGIRKRSRHSGKRCGVSSCGYALHRARMAFRYTAAKKGDCRTLAASVSCGQDIAGDGAFSLGMIADYMDSPWLSMAPASTEISSGRPASWPGAVPRGGRGGHSFDRDRLLLR